MDPITYGIVGSGWRAEHFLRIARELPDRFRVSGLLSRSPETRDAIARAFGVATPSSLDELLAARPDFVVLSVAWPATPVFLAELTERGIPVLAETPPAPDLDGLRRLAPLARRGARIQVAEQYQFQPIHAARIAIARRGGWGPSAMSRCRRRTATTASTSSAGCSADEFAPVTIRARRFESTIVAGPDRAGPPVGERIVPSSQVIATLEFDGPSAVFDFSEDQYFSWVRSNRVLVRGERGEIHDTTVRYLREDGSPAIAEIRRHETGRDSNFEGLGLVGLTLDGEWVARNEFVGARAPGRRAGHRDLPGQDGRVPGWRPRLLLPGRWRPRPPPRADDRCGGRRPARPCTWPATSGTRSARARQRSSCRARVPRARRYARFAGGDVISILDMHLGCISSGEMRRPDRWDPRRRNHREPSRRTRGNHDADHSRMQPICISILVERAPARIVHIGGRGLRAGGGS